MAVPPAGTWAAAGPTGHEGVMGHHFYKRRRPQATRSSGVMCVTPHSTFTNSSGCWAHRCCLHPCTWRDAGGIVLTAAVALLSNACVSPRRGLLTRHAERAVGESLSL
jgi:hypothetical protein